MNNDLISRSAAIEQVERREKILGSSCLISTRSFKNFLMNRPAIDAEHVVRCKDCGLAETIGIGEDYVYCNHFNMAVFENNYCGYAEEKMDAEV
jgi:hypothetical protein